MRIVLFLFFLRLHCVICKNACLVKAFPERGSFKDILKKVLPKTECVQNALRRARKLGKSAQSNRETGRKKYCGRER